MIHTIVQVLGLVIAACGAWFAFGPGGAGLVVGLSLTIGSVLVELGAQPTNGSSD
jgi:hypothetical protein